MAGILNPKSRFFDTFLTKEGRRQLANGEIRTRFVSFSDSLTAYDQSELGVVDSKDGSIFFEAMSRPQDSIITENPSVINMMELRNPSAQPAFLAKEIKDENGEVTTTSLTNAAMFGKEILVPPDGREILVVTSSGIDRKNVDYDLRSQFYISGSRSQELLYNNRSSGFRGWWIFDETVTQLNEFTTPACLNFERNLTLPSITSVNSISGASLTASTTAITFASNIATAIAAGDHIGFKDTSTGERISYTVQTAITANSSNTLAVKYTSALSVNTHQAAQDGTNNKRDAQPAMMMKIASINTTHLLSANVSQNLSSSSPLSTNAVYMTYDSVSNRNVIDPSPVFDENCLPAISELNKSYKTKENGFIQINLRENHYDSASWKDTDDGTPRHWGYGGNKSEYVNQLSVWFSISTTGFDSGKNQMIMQLWSSNTRKSIEIFAVADKLKIVQYNSESGAAESAEEISGIEAESWHRVSLVYGNVSGVKADPKTYFRVVLDGDLRKSLRTENTTTNFLYRNLTDVIIGNSLATLSSQPDDESRLNGSIQECQYFILPRKIDTDFPDIPMVPALGIEVLDERYTTETSLLATATTFNMTGQYPEDADSPQDQVIDNYARYKEPEQNRSQFVTLSGSKIDVRDSLREWVHYNPIRDEGALYFAGIGTKTYVKEKQLERGVSRATIKEAVNRASMTMSGSLLAYRHLGLLQHLDLDLRTSGSAPLTIERHRVVQLDTNEDDVVNTALQEVPLSQTTVFDTRLKMFPLVEPVYGKSPNNYSNFEPRRIENTVGPASGRFLENAGTVFALNEIIDNELDNDELTFSSSRIPNYFLLPPIAADYFRFDHDGTVDSISDAMSWKEFLRRRSTSREQNIESIQAGDIDEAFITSAQNKARYLELMSAWYKTLIPKSTLDNLLKRFGNSRSFDSNEGLVRYLVRDRNVSGNPNNIDFDLSQFKEEIQFTNTSESNNSFVQMFECAKEDGKATFNKLVIRDLGVIRKWAGAEFGTMNWSMNDGRRISGVSDDPLSQSWDQRIWGGLSHVFAFGKLIDKKTNPNVPGTEIYFFPIFTLEFEIEAS